MWVNKIAHYRKINFTCSNAVFAIRHNLHIWWLWCSMNLELTVFMSNLIYAVRLCNEILDRKAVMINGDHLIHNYTASLTVTLSRHKARDWLKTKEARLQNNITTDHIFIKKIAIFISFQVFIRKTLMAKTSVQVVLVLIHQTIHRRHQLRAIVAKIWLSTMVIQVAQCENNSNTSIHHKMNLKCYIYMYHSFRIVVEQLNQVDC